MKRYVRIKKTSKARNLVRNYGIAHYTERLAKAEKLLVLDKDIGHTCGIKVQDPIDATVFWYLPAKSWILLK